MLCSSYNFSNYITRNFRYSILVVKELFSKLHIQIIMNLAQSTVKMVQLRKVYLFIYACKFHYVLLVFRNVFNWQNLQYKKLNFTMKFIRVIVKYTHHQLYWILILSLEWEIKFHWQTYYFPWFSLINIWILWFLWFCNNPDCFHITVKSCIILVFMVELFVIESLRKTFVKNYFGHWRYWQNFFLLE